MASYEKGRALPKFGEWDENDPASAEGFSVIFNKARDERKTGAAAVTSAGNAYHYHNRYGETKCERPSSKRKWFCCFSI